jgi:hypothetical protein
VDGSRAIVLGELRGWHLCQLAAFAGADDALRAQVHSLGVPGLPRDSQRVTTAGDTRLYRLQDDPQVQLPEGIVLNVISAGEVMASSRRPVISFGPDGGSTGGAVRLSLEDRSTTISIDWLTGAVTTASGGGDAPQT